MKILYVLNNGMEYAGTESVVLNYFKYVNSPEFQIDFMLHTTEEECKNNKICADLKEKGSHIYCVTPRKDGLKKNINDIKTVLDNGNYDIIHSHTDCVSGIILQIAKKMNVPIRIAHSHNTQSEVKGGYMKRKIHLFILWLCKMNLRRVATHYMACSKEAGKWLFGRQIMESGKVYILHNAIDIERFAYNAAVREKIRKELGYEDNFVIGNVGRFSYQKNQEYLIEVFSKFLKHEPKARLLLIGSGETQTKMKALVEKLGIKNYVNFYGNSNRVNELLQAMDVFCFPSKFEGLGVVLIEAQASGLPCIVTENKRISKETNITSLIKRIPLRDMDAWIEAINSSKKMKRGNVISDIEKAGYSLKYESEKLKKFYLDIVDAV
jgi:glycosyltransferase involved in cell wall biosynthesis